MEIAYFNDIRQKILTEISKSEKAIRIAVCWFTNQQLFEAICKKLKEDVLIELIIINDYINNRKDGLKFKHFIKLGGKFYFGNNDKPMHNKYCIIDNNVLINGSYNWTYFAEHKNEENIIIHYGNEALIEAFSKDFERIKTGLTIVKKVISNVIVEIPEMNFLGIQNYLAQDYLYKASETKNPSIVEKAFLLTPNNIEIQKKAVELKLKTKRITTIPIGEDIINDGFTVLIPTDTIVPSCGESYFTTIKDNQLTINVTIRYGDNKKASLNKLIGTFKFDGIPSMKKGGPSLVTKWSIDINGILLVTEIIKQTNNRISMSYDINHLLKK